MSGAAIICEERPKAPRPALRVERASQQDAAQWDRYVAARQDASFFHRFGWGTAVNAAYGYESLYLAAKRGADIVGVLPLIDVKSRLLGRSLISTAFTVGGGPVGDDHETARALADEAVRLGEDRRVKYVKLRSDHAALDGWSRKGGSHASFKMPLPADENEHLSLFPKRRRAEVKKALAAEHKGVLRCYVGDDLDRFYALYAWSLRRLGTPIFPKRYLKALMDAFPGETELSFADFEGKPAAALLSFYDKDRVYPYYVGGAPCARGARAHEMLYWSLMRRAALRGATTFEFGRSKVNSGPYRFKKLWGAEAQPVVYRYKLVRSECAPNVSPANPKFSLLAKLWTHLPLFAANRVGPLLAPNFP